MNRQNIRVQGKGIVSQAPDRIRIVFTLTGTDLDFAKAVEDCNQGIEFLRAAAESCGIIPTELKTTDFNVREETEYVSGKHRHAGFKSTHHLCVVLPLDRDLVGRFLSAVLRGKARPQINLSFEVSDAEGLKQKVLASAVENAKRRAETIANASGVKLGRIWNIEYGYTEIRVSSQPCDMVLESAELREVAPNFEPDDVEAQDTVTVTWEIEG